MDSFANEQADGAEPESGLDAERGTDLADVSRMSLTDILAADETVLANSLRRLLTELDRPQEIIASHQNYIR